MQKYYGVVILLNVVGIVAAYKLFGLFIAIGAYAGIYFATRNMTLKKGLPERLSFAVIQLLGVFAVHKFFQEPILTSMTLMVQFVLFFIFTSGRRVDV